MTTAPAGPREVGAQDNAAGFDVDAAPQLTGELTGEPRNVAAGDSSRIVVLLDPVALQTARDAAVAEAGRADKVGDFLVATADDDIAVTVEFAATQPGYRGWHWSVTLAIISEEHPTVSEVVLLPGEGALLAPAWIPWEQRIRPGDVGVGDLLPLTVDDPRVVPAYLQSDDPAVEAVAVELGVGRSLVMSREGRVDFAERLHDGSFGSSADVALAAPAHCFTCAFFLPLAGSLGQLLGACGNEFSPADGRVVDAGYGCGAHSDTVIDMPARSAATDTVIDELALEVHRRPLPAAVEDVGDNSPPGFSELGSPDEDEAKAALLESIDVDLIDPDLLGEQLLQDQLAEAALLDTDQPVDASVDPESTEDADVADLELPDADMADIEVAEVDEAVLESAAGHGTDVEVVEAYPDAGDVGAVPDIEA